MLGVETPTTVVVQRKLWLAFRMEYGASVEYKDCQDDFSKWDMSQPLAWQQATIVALGIFRYCSPTATGPHRPTDAPSGDLHQSLHDPQASQGVTMETLMATMA